MSSPLASLVERLRSWILFPNAVEQIGERADGSTIRFGIACHTPAGIGAPPHASSAAGLSHT
jgi:hypothetical protein